MQVPYYFVADFEAILKTKKIQEYIPCSFAYIKVYYDGQLYSEKIYVRLNTAQRFIIEITQEVMAIYEEYKQSKPIIPLLPEEEEIYNNAEHCWVCEKEFERLEEK
ncbi:13979_t:CDS:1, partial [Rhizophagus irregularis]